MHIPDGFINGATSLGAGVAAAGGLSAGLRRAGRDLQERRVPLAGLVGAFIFAMQMVNFPVGAGTSGHLIGGALAAILVGPWVATVVLSVVVIVQALLFADGGVSALGLNIVNMAVVAPWVGWAVFRGVRWLLRKTERSTAAASFTGAALSVVASSVAFSAEYAIGGTGGAPVSTVLVAMIGVHTLIGIGEGFITGAVVGAVLSYRPDLVHGANDVKRSSPAEGRSRKAWVPVAAGLGAALVVAALISPFASSDPDGLERVAIDQGFATSEEDHALADSPLADYALTGDDSPFSTAVAGVAGVVATFALGAGVFALRSRTRRETTIRP